MSKGFYNTTKTLQMDSEMDEREWLEIKKARNNFLASCLLFL
ncbi:hypothetical protein SPHINGO8BC_70114 [Sphingobacterium multivorum]|uniref:Uncharacterized protein n=1 Tax=Sphingobacterium multivorum TaxID=28454 RepID=A0A654DNA9_SPHMU|nr:hypothetical protein SPHINGO8BC_70114 [Sphingobacterium multivorum]